MAYPTDVERGTIDSVASRAAPPADRIFVGQLRADVDLTTGSSAVASSIASGTAALF
jgi:hypothetical protein